MEWLSSLFGHVVGLDTAPLIYYMERNPDYLSVLQPFFEAVEQGKIEIVTSTLTLTEVLVHPLRQGNYLLAREYSRILLGAPHVRTLAVSPAIAMEAAHLRSTRGYKTPDAVQLATAHVAQATSFLTNDDALVSTISLQVLILKQLRVRP